MNIKKVVKRALEDPKFADKLRKTAAKAHRDGAGSKAELDFNKLLAEDDADLAALTASGPSPLTGIGTTPYKGLIALLLKEVANK